MTEYELITKMKENLSVWKNENEIRKGIKDEIIILKQELNKHLELCTDLNIAQVALQSFKVNYKKDVIDNLISSLNQTINTWFDSKYNLYIDEYTRGSNAYARLIDTVKGGNLNKVCGDACLSTLQLLLSVALVKLLTTGDSFLFLDEVFSKFSENKIQVIPDILDSLLEDIKQLIIIEHKYEVLNLDDETIVYQVQMINGKSTITPISNIELYDKILKEVN